MSPPRPWKDGPPKEPVGARLADRLTRLPTPAAPAGAQERVWARLHAAAHRPRRRRLPLLMAAATATVVGLTVWVAGPLVAARRPEPATRIETAEGVRWSSEPHRRARIEEPALATLVLAPSTEVWRVEDPPHLELRQGRLWAVAAPRLAVVAGRWRVEGAAGSTWSLDRRGPRVEVVVGRVRVSAAGQQQWVNEGESLLLGRPARPDESTDRDAAPSQERGPPPPDAAPDPSHTGRATEPAPIAPPDPADAPSPSPTRRASAPAISSAEPDDPGTLYRRARAESDPDRAVVLFDRVFAYGGAWAEMAGLQSIRRRMAQGALNDAERRLDRQDAAFPSGDYAPEAWLMRIDLAVRRRRPADAGAALDRYLAARPESARAAELFLMRGDLRRRSGDCRGARTDYRRVGRSPYVDPARFFEAWCLGIEEDRPAARAAYGRYLAEFPNGRFRAPARRALERLE